MASSYHARRQRKSRQTFSSALSSAAAEWLLILLIYLDGLFSYLATKFAHHCRLQIPCLLCSRLDHLLGCEGLAFYKDLICHAHKLEISSLAYCHVHQKLVDVHEVCETCLLSFATEKKAYPKTCRSLVGKSERNLTNGGNFHSTLTAAVDADGSEVKLKGEDGVEVPLLKRDHMLDSPRTWQCSCCNELFYGKSHVQRMLQTKSIECGDALLGQAGHDCLHHCDRSNRKREKSILSSSAPQTENWGFDRLSHIGYTELRITSDSKSEAPLSDDYDGNPPVGTRRLKEYPLPPSLRPEPVKSDQNNFMMPEKLIHAAPGSPAFSRLITLDQFRVVEHDAKDSSMPEVPITVDKGDLSWNAFRRKGHPSTTLNPTSQDTKILDEAEVHAPAYCTATTQESDSNSVPAKDKLEVSDSKSGEVGTGDVALVSSTTYVEAPKDMISTRTELKQIQTTHKLASSVINHMDLNDAYKLAIGYRMSPRDSSRSQEDMKFFLSQISAGRGLEFLNNDATPTPSPRVYGLLDALKMSDASSAVNHQILSKKFSNDKSEPGSESLDGGTIDEIDGESLIDRLKRQIDLDRKFMSLLYRELEEERSASAIAANQAMAMITRLQEEKAAMQMEALQYQRMMEEQAEYDQEALQETNDLLTEKEKEIQDLEAEIESYKKRLGEESFPTKMKRFSEEREDNLSHTLLTQTSEGNKALEQNDAMFLDAGECREVISKDSLLDFEDEKLYISECLKTLEKKLHLFSRDGVYVDISAPDVRNSFHLDNEPENSPFPDNESKEAQVVSRTTDLTAIENEVLHLRERLGDLEANRKFLEHSVNSLRNGNDGVRFIQEIASHLRELRRVGARKREQIEA